MIGTPGSVQDRHACKARPGCSTDYPYSMLLFDAHAMLHIPLPVYSSCGTHALGRHGRRVLRQQQGHVHEVAPAECGRRQLQHLRGTKKMFSQNNSKAYYETAFFCPLVPLLLAQACVRGVHDVSAGSLTTVNLQLVKILTERVPGWTSQVWDCSSFCTWLILMKNKPMLLAISAVMACAHPHALGAYMGPRARHRVRSPVCHPALSVILSLGPARLSLQSQRSVVLMHTALCKYVRLCMQV